MLAVMRDIVAATGAKVVGPQEVMRIGGST